MAHKNSLTEKEINKTFIFKTTCGKDDILSLWKPAAEEYCKYYNALSQWIANNLTTIRIGDLAQYIDNRESKYYKAVTDVAKKDLPLYKIFQKGFNTQCADNALYRAIKTLNPERYAGNSLGLNTTNYRQYGYVQSVLGNFRTKMSTLKASVKWKRFDPDNVDEETLKQQTMCDVSKYGIENAVDFKNLIDELRSREETPKLTEKISRLSRIFEYYSNNEKSVRKAIEETAIAKLQDFGGCVRKNADTLTIYQQGFRIEKCGNTGFNMHIVLDKKPYVIHMLGNRQVVRFTEGKRTDTIDIAESHGDFITFSIKDGTLFTHLTAPVTFDKEASEITKAVGVDINIKHMMMATSITDNGHLKGYLNLYRELLNDPSFLSTFSDSESGTQELATYRKIAENVNFGILETESLFERVAQQAKGRTSDNRLMRRESAMEKVFTTIARTTSDTHLADYVNYNKMLRAKYKAYFILKEKYYEKQHEYDRAMGFTDKSASSKDTMDKRRFEHPFAGTDAAKQLLSKLRNVEQDIIGCRDNIVTYAFRVFKDNGYDTIALEYLDSSQFDKLRMPTPTSLLKYHKFEGKTREEAELLMNEGKFNKAHYTMHYGDDNTVDNIEFSEEGLWRQKKLNFMNLIPKAIRFADIKDKFVQLCNNSHMNTVLCPAAFISQMDSLTHALYYVPKKTSDRNGMATTAFTLAGKRTVRTTQETHINGLNADYNSACNLRHIATDDTLRGDMTDTFKPSKTHKTMYGVPAWNIKPAFKKRISMKTIETFRKRGNVVYGHINGDGEFVPQQDFKTAR